MVRLYKTGARVPPGFAVTTSAYREFMAHIDAKVNSILGRMDPKDLASTENASREITELVRSEPISEEMALKIRDAYAELARSESGAEGVLPVAVRSSATAEDMLGSSVAGQHETFLWVRGGDQVVDHVKGCWASAFAARSLSYRQARQIAQSGVEMGVVVQKMVNSQKSGVMFTLNPSNGDPSKISIDATWGLGEATVSGVVTPDLYIVDKVTLEILTRKISRKHIEFVVSDDEVKEVEVPKERQEIPSLRDQEVLELAKTGKSIEKAFGRPLDIEWALDSSPDIVQALYILQARPETVWSSKSGPKTNSRDSVDRVVDTLKRGQKVQ